MKRELKIKLKELKEESLKTHDNSDILINKILKVKNINYIDENGNSILMHAAALGYTSLVKLLLESEVDVNYACNNTDALVLAVKNNRLEVIKILLKDFEIKNFYVLLKYAIENCNFEITNLILDKCKNLEEYEDILIETLFYIITSKLNMENKIKMTKFLLIQGVNPNITNRYFETPLMKVIKSNIKGTELARILLDNGADPNYSSDDGVNLLMFAIMKKRIDLAELLIEKNANINLKDLTGKTALMIASEYNSLEIVKTLLKKGTDINEVDRYGNSALIYAVKNKNEEVVKYLLEYSLSNYPITKDNPYGANPNVKNAYGYMPLFYAVGNTKIFELLLRHGANPSYDLNGENFIFYLIYTRQIQEMKLLLEYGINPNLRDKYGNTLLIYALNQNDIKLVFYLIRKGAVPDENFYKEVELLPEHNNDIEQRIELQKKIPKRNRII